MTRWNYGGFQIPWTFSLGNPQHDETIVLMQEVKSTAHIYPPRPGVKEVTAFSTYIELIGFIKPNGTAVTIPGTAANLKVIKDNLDPNLEDTAPVTLPADSAFTGVVASVVDYWTFMGTQNATHGNVTMTGTLRAYALTPAFLNGWKAVAEADTKKFRETPRGKYPASDVFVWNPMPPGAAGGGGFAVNTVFPSVRPRNRLRHCGRTRNSIFPRSGRLMA